jgi:hypothetical protein
LGLSLHVIDVYLACLAPTAPPPAALAALLRPFVTLLAQEGHPVLVERARATVLAPLAQGDAELQLAPSELTVRTTNQKISHAMQHVLMWRACGAAQLVGAMLFDTAADAATKARWRSRACGHLRTQCDCACDGSASHLSLREI